VQINQAIAALAGGGGRVVLSAGTFHITCGSTADRIILKSNLTIEGAGIDVTNIVMPTNPTEKKPFFYEGNTAGSISNVVFKNLTLDCGNYPMAGNPAIRVEGIYMRYADYVTLNHIKVKSGSERSGSIYLWACRHVLVDGCIFDGAWFAVHGNYPGSETDPTTWTGTDTKVQNCTFLHGSPLFFGCGVYSNDFVISNNTFYGDGIAHSAIDTGTSSRVTIDHNTISGTFANVAIYNEGGSFVSVTNNVISDNNSNAIDFRNQRSLAQAIMGNNLVDGNIITNCHNGILSDGIGGMTIQNNTLRNIHRHGIYLQFLTPVYPDNCKITNNQILNFGVESTYNRGIYLSDASHCTVNSNTVDGAGNPNADWCIYEAGSSDYNTITNNSVKGSSNAAQIHTVGAHTLVSASSPTPTPTPTVTPKPTPTPTITPTPTPTPTPPSYFTIAVLPDTQMYTESHPAIFDQQAQWIVNNAQSQNIVFVAQLGDLTNDWGTTSQWQNAEHSMNIIRDSGIPYSVVPGNHDLNFSAGDATYFNNYFPYTEFTGYSWYGGHYPSSSDTSSYELFSAMGQDFVVLNVVCTPALESAAESWANSILTTYSNRQAIVITHGYIDTDGTYETSSNVDGAKIWNNIVKSHSNVIMVLCGHMHNGCSGSMYHNTATGVNGNTVYQILTDFQDCSNGGNGWLRLYKFYPATNTVSAITYSPYLNQYNTSTGATGGQFDFPF